MGALQLTPLRHFVAVAEMRSIGLAARTLHISQPALTRSVQRLEKESGGALFERGTRGVTLTPRGEVLLPYAKAMLAEAERATEHLHSGDRRRQTRISLGTSPNFSLHITPAIIADFIGEYPDANLRTVTGSGEQLLAMLAAAELDLAVTIAWGTTLQMALAKNPDIAHEKVARLSAGVFAPADHPLAQGSGTVELGELARERWGVPHGMSISYVFRDVFLERNLAPPTQVINSSNADHMLELSRQLGLLLIIPRHVAATSVASGNMVALDCPPLAIPYQVELLTRRRGTQPLGLPVLRELVREHFARAQLD